MAELIVEKDVGHQESLDNDIDLTFFAICS